MLSFSSRSLVTGELLIPCQVTMVRNEPFHLVEYLQQRGQPAGCMVILEFSKAYDRFSRP